MVAWQAELTKCYHLPWPQSGFCSTLALLTFILAQPQHLTLPLFASSADKASQHVPGWKCRRSWGSKGEFLLRNKCKIGQVLFKGTFAQSLSVGPFTKRLGCDAAI